MRIRLGHASKPWPKGLCPHCSGTGTLVVIDPPKAGQPRYDRRGDYLHLLTAAITNGAILSRHKINADIEHLDLEVPILSEPQTQDDVFFREVIAALDAYGLIVRTEP